MEKSKEKYEEFLSFAKELTKRSNLHRLVIYKSNSKVFMEVPLTAGAVAGGMFYFYSNLISNWSFGCLI